MQNWKNLILLTESIMLKNIIQTNKKPAKDLIKSFYCTKYTKNSKFNLDPFEYEDNLDLNKINVGIAQQEEINLVEENKNKKRLQIISRKYFKPPREYNFLSWSQKQTIKSLYNQDPMKWSIEYLVENYPITIDGLKKLLRSNWKISANFSVAKHDLSVSENWNLLRQNKLPINQDVKDHLMKFSNEQNKYFQFEDTKKLNGSNKSMIKGEFHNFIKSFQNSKSCENNINHNQDRNYEDYFIGPIKNTKPTTFESFKNHHLLNKIISNESMNNLSLNSKNDINENKIHQKTQDELNRNNGFNAEYPFKSENEMENSNISFDEKSNEIEKKYFKNTTKNEVSEKIEESLEENKENTYLEPLGTYKEIEIPHRIKIPKEKFKAGATYKRNDIFYDDDGVFLYRVPGLK